MGEPNRITALDRLGESLREAAAKDIALRVLRRKVMFGLMLAYSFGVIVGFVMAPAWQILVVHITALLVLYPVWVRFFGLRMGTPPDRVLYVDRGEAPPPDTYYFRPRTHPAAGDFVYEPLTRSFRKVTSADLSADQGPGKESNF